MHALKKLEICVYTLESAIKAQNAGADRIELCENSFEGGVTPSYGNILLAKKMLTIPINVMIRPRGGNFIYSEFEFNAMKEDIKICKEIGVNGVVFGILHKNKTIDKKRCSELVDLAKPLTTTFHKAFDIVTEPFIAMNEIIDCQFNRILTSGLKSNAMEGAILIAKLIKEAKEKIIIMPGGGVRADNLSDLSIKTKSIEFHSSAIIRLISNKKKLDNKTYSKTSLNDNTSNLSVNQNEILKMKQILNYSH